MGFAENLRDELEYQGIQVKELAERTGLSINTLNKYRPGSIVTPTVENALKIAKVLNVSLDFLATGTEYQNHKTKSIEFSELEKKLRHLSDSDLRALSGVVDAILEKYK